MSFNFKTTYSTPYFDIEEGFDSNHPNTEPYYRLTGLDSVICCAMTMKGEFVMVKQFRPRIEEYTLEFPAGGLTINEKPIDAAKREFLEETSFSLDFLYLGDFKLMMNRTNIKEHIFFGLNPKKIDQSNPEKGLEVSFVNRQELINRSITGGYKQLAGLGIIQLVSNYLRLDIMNSSMEDISKKFREKKNNEK